MAGLIISKLLTDFFNEIDHFQTLAVDHDLSALTAPLGTRITSWTN